jgi:hypothetical protein
MLYETLRLPLLDVLNLLLINALVGIQTVDNLVAHLDMKSEHRYRNIKQLNLHIKRIFMRKHGIIRILFVMDTIVMQLSHLTEIQCCNLDSVLG